MKKIKKLTLNKEVVSILGGNEMNRVKGGQIYNYGVIGDTVDCAGGGGGNQAKPTEDGGTCVGNNTCPGGGNTCLNCIPYTYTCPNAPNPIGSVVDVTCIGASCVGNICTCLPR